LVKNIFFWYADGSITDAELITALEFLILEGIINIPEQDDVENDMPFDIITCNKGEKFYKLKDSATNNHSVSHSFELILYVSDSDDNILTFTEHIEMNVLLGTTVYFDRYVDPAYLKKYSLTLDQFNAMMESQDNKCTMCKKPETVKRDNIVFHNKRLEYIFSFF